MNRLMYWLSILYVGRVLKSVSLRTAQQTEGEKSDMINSKLWVEPRLLVFVQKILVVSKLCCVLMTCW